jgi:hypothetical protein
MIEHARAPGRFSTVGPAGQRQTVFPAFNVRGTRSFRERGSPGSINRGDGKGECLTSPLGIRSLCFLPSPRPRTLPTSLLLASFSNRRLPSSQLSPAMAPPHSIVVLEPLHWNRSTMTPFAPNELVNSGLLASAGDGGVSGVDGPAGFGPRAQPTIRLRC